MFYIFAKIEIIFKRQKNKDITILLYLCYKTYYFTFQSLVASAMRYFSIMTLLYILTNIEHFYPKRLIKDTSLQVFTYKKLYLKDYIFLKDKRTATTQDYRQSPHRILPESKDEVYLPFPTKNKT